MSNDQGDRYSAGTEGKNKPSQAAFWQQSIVAVHPILLPWRVISTFLVIAAIFIPVGFKLVALSDDLIEEVHIYDDHNDASPVCGIDSANEGKTCFIKVTIGKDVEPPVFVHYQLENFHQNHRKYQESRDDYQLLGSLSQSKVQRDLCKPLNKLGNITINPCGLIANTLFNDVIELNSVETPDGSDSSLELIEKGIAWVSDVNHKFAQPEGFKYEECSSCDDCSCDGDSWSCQSPYKKDDTCYRYFYPNDDTTQYLYETYPMVVSPLEGVTNEHFIVWMRVAALPTFRKLYGYFDQPIAAGTVLSFKITANFEVKSFKGAKAIILSNSNTFGGKNKYLGPSFIGVGVVCAALGVYFALKQLVNPRKLADRKYLVYKEDPDRKNVVFKDD